MNGIGIPFYRRGHMKIRTTLIVGLLLLGFVEPAAAEGEKAEKEITPTMVVKVFWYKIEKGDVDGALSLFAFSQHTKALIPRQRATFATWSKVMKKGTTLVTVGPEKRIGTSAAVLITSREGKTKVRRDVMYLVRKEKLWRILAYAVPGDSPAHQLDDESVAAMKKLKEWARAEMKKEK
jgi:hypothetical protein